MKFQSLVTAMTTMLLVVTPSSAYEFSCQSSVVDSDVAYGSSCSTILSGWPYFPTHLRSLYLDGDFKFAYLDEEVFAEFTRLESLSLTRMLIREIWPCALCFLPELRSVALDIVTLFEGLPPELLANVSKLQEFSAAWSWLKDVPEELFAGNPDLRKVDLSGNELTIVPRGLFLGRTQLVSVNLSGNALTHLPSGIFATNINLQTVFLAGNRLTSLPLGAFDRNPQMALLWLDGNALTSPLEGLSSHVYRTLSLERNPLSCDCALQSNVTQLERQLGWTVSLPEGCGEEMVCANCTTPAPLSSSSSSPMVVVTGSLCENETQYANCTKPSSSSSPVVVVATGSLYLGVVGWTIWWQVTKGLLDT